MRLAILDDDETSRELLLLFAAEAGLEASAEPSGDADLARLTGGGDIPTAVLADMRMPGTTGSALAQALRRLCGPATRLIAMSGSQPTPDELAGFDHFLLKPFGPDELRAAVVGDVSKNGADVQDTSILSMSTYRSLAESMPPKQLAALYTMCLDDAERRIRDMRAATDDPAAWVRGAHAIKGGCGMVGALELAAIADRMERDGMRGDDQLGALDEFMTAMARLRGMLDGIAAEQKKAG